MGGLYGPGPKGYIKLNDLEIRVTAPIWPAAHPWRRTGQAGQPCLCEGAPFEDMRISSADRMAVAQWRPENISKVVLAAGAGAWGQTSPPLGKGKP